VRHRPPTRALAAAAAAGQKGALCCIIDNAVRTGTIKGELEPNSALSFASYVLLPGTLQNSHALGILFKQESLFRLSKVLYYVFLLS